MGGGGKKLLTLAGREADIVGLHLKVNDDGTVDASERTEVALSRKVEWVRQAAGERFSAVELNLLVATVIVTHDPMQSAEQYIRDNERVKMTAEQLVANPYALIGNVEQLTERLFHLRAQFGITYIVVGSECMETFASVVARLTGV
jgi:hypothetical protein